MSTAVPRAYAEAAVLAVLVQPDGLFDWYADFYTPTQVADMLEQIAAAIREDDARCTGP